MEVTFIELRAWCTRNVTASKAVWFLSGEKRLIIATAQVNVPTLDRHLIYFFIYRIILCSVFCFAFFNTSNNIFPVFLITALDKWS
jgi:hypothetical protein